MRQRQFLLLLLSFFSQIVFAQDSIPQSQLRYGILFSPDYNYRSLRSGSNDAWIKELYDTLEVPEVGYSAGLIAQLQLNDRFAINGGLQFSDRGEATRYRTRERIQKYRNHLYYLAIPLQVNYNLVNKKVKFFVSVGISTDIFLTGRTKVQSRYSTDAEIVKPADDLSRAGLSMLAGVGLDCPLTDKWSFRLSPLYRRSLTSATTSSPKKYYYSAGLSVGFLGEF